MAKTMKDLLEEFRVKAGALEYKGHEYLDLNRFADDTKHMIIFDVVKDDCSWGEKGDRMRLYLNDVGYGKAEVSIRAAFKSCMDQKQVAYLVPTTILANQQYESFKERMKEIHKELIELQAESNELMNSISKDLEELKI